MLVSNNLCPFFRILVRAGHDNLYLIRPCRTQLKDPFINFHSYRAGIGNDHSFAGQKILTIVLVMIKNIIHKRFDGLVISENGLHLPEFFFTSLNDIRIGVFRHNVIFFIDQRKRVWIEL